MDLLRELEPTFAIVVFFGILVLFILYALPKGRKNYKKNNFSQKK